MGDKEFFINEEKVKLDKKDKNVLDVKEEKLLQPKVDIVFQSLFNKNNMGITKSFAEAILEEKIESIVINDDKELIRERPEDKLGILDLQLDINNKEKVDVEIQLVKKKDFIKRLIWYLSRMYGSQLKKGEEYNKLKRVVLVAIIDFEIEEVKEIEEMETVWRLAETKKHKKILTDEIEVRIININRAKEEYKRDKRNRKAQWILFIDNPNSEEVKEIMKENEEIKEAVITVKKMTEEEKEERLEFLREKARMDATAIREAGYDDGYSEGTIEGEIKGKKAAKKEMIKNMSLMGIPIEQIVKISKMTEEEIKEIIKKNK